MNISDEVITTIYEVVFEVLKRLEKCESIPKVRLRGPYVFVAESGTFSISVRDKQLCQIFKSGPSIVVKWDLDTAIFGEIKYDWVQAKDACDPSYDPVVSIRKVINIIFKNRKKIKAKANEIITELCV